MSKVKRSLFSLLFSLCYLLFAVSCLPGKNKTAVLWSDCPEFAFYCEYFNAAQDQYKIEMQYGEPAAGKLPDEKNMPDIIAGSRMPGSSTRLYFKPLDKYFREKSPLRGAFYPGLLDMGNIDGKQYLLPVSFNAPVILFSRDKSGEMSNPFTIDFDEMKKLGKDFNVSSRGVYSRMGFSPVWDDNFLYVIATLFNAEFRESDPLAWDAAAVENAMAFAREWNTDSNTGIRAVEDFTFKYFNSPPEKLAQTQRILFTYMDSDSFFIISGDRRNNLDFRWLAERNIIPLAERSVYLGMVKKGRAPKAAGAFLLWFFNTDTQRDILEKSRQNRMLETSFGIGGGFSAMRPVTEQVFPRFYPDLPGHMPPEDFLSPAKALPGNWTTLKERVVLPYLHDRVRQDDSEGVYPLERRLADWQRTHR